jgi:thioesterase domain-containing protein
MNLGKDQPVYGLRARTEDGARGCSSVEDMAATYVRAVRRMVPSGRYYLGGYSGGGLIAYEMAQQLRSAGEDVRLLVMIDCPAPGRKRGPRFSRRAMSHLVKNTMYWLVDDDFLRGGLTAARGRLRSRVLRERDRLRKALQRGTPYEPDIRHALGLWAFADDSREFLETLARALRTYAPKPYPGAITVIRARTRKLGRLTPATADLGWERLASDGVQTRMVIGAHDTIIREPRVRMLAHVLTELLDNAIADRQLR